MARALAGFLGKRCYCTSGLIKTKDYGRVRVIEINRSPVRNAVNRATAIELFNAFNELEKEESVSVGILAGNGGNFCAGYDLKELATKEEKSIESLFEPFSVSDPAPMVIEKPQKQLYY